MGRGSAEESSIATVDAPVSRAGLTARYQQDHHVYERHSTRQAPAGFIGIRLDGRAFHTLTKDMEKPFDPRFEQAINAACERLMTEIPEIVSIYTQSDEITAVLGPSSSVYDRRHEKLVSTCASITSVAFSQALGQPGIFDARLLELPREEDVLAMLSERQQDALKNAVSSAAYWALRKTGLSGTRAARRLSDQGGMHKRMELLREMDIDFNEIPPARRRGRMLIRKHVQHRGYNPIEKREVITTRRRLSWDEDIPDFRTVQRLPGWAPPENDAEPASA